MTTADILREGERGAYAVEYDPTHLAFNDDELRASGLRVQRVHRDRTASGKTVLSLTYRGTANG